MNLKSHSKSIQLLLIVSLSLLLYKGIYLAIIGNPYLLPVAIIFPLGIGLTWWRKKESVMKLIKAWGVLLIIYAIIRTLLTLIISLDLGGIEAYIINQVGVWMYLSNMIILVAGILIISKRRLMMKVGTK